jgi:tetratricopeptide (TPR) repeat protein
MMGRGSASEAHALFVRATTADPRHPSLWANLASSLKALGRRTEELDALEKALELEPRHLSALLQKGAYLEETGDVRNAARTYQNALACIAPNAEVPAAVREALAHARSLVQSDQAQLLAQLEQPLAAVRERHGGAGQRRFEACLEILMGQRSAYHSQPTWMYFPGLPAIEFFERGDFPWLDALEAATEEIRAELLRVLVADREGPAALHRLSPSMPLDQWRDLNRSRAWSAWLSWNQGAPMPGTWRAA